VAGSLTLPQHGWVNTRPVVAHTQTQQMIVVPDFRFDPMCVCVLEGIS
jgi:hypothetical protein